MVLLDLAINNWFVQIFVSILSLILTWKALKWITSTTIVNGNPNSRRLDFLETLTEILSHSFDGSGNLSCCITLTSKESLSFEHVHDALVLLAKRQPMLRAVVSINNDGEQYFDIRNVVDAIKLFDITRSEVKISDWKDILYKYTSTVHKSSLPWKAVILQEEFDSTTQEYSNMIMFAIKHSCFDGIACVQFVQQFLNNMNEISSGVSNVDKYVTSLELLPSAHSLVIQKRISHSLFRFIVSQFGLRPILEFLLEKMIFYCLKKKAVNPFYHKHPPLQRDKIPYDKRERISLRIFTEQETKSIVDACKDNGCTVTGAITAAVHLAFYELLNEKYEQKINTETLLPINNRSLCDPKSPDDYLGAFAYFQNHCFKYSHANPENFWIMAKESTAQLKEILGKKTFVKELSFMSVLDPNILRKMLFDKDSFLKGNSNSISSYGVFNFHRKQEGDPITYTLKNSYIFPIMPNENTLFAHFPYTINGKLTWIIKSRTTISEAHAQKFINSCFDIILANCSSSMKK
ncbi:uncharacterized protein LOC124455550 [Xenia sp. Carnegie-2017]|uniref:uncharacterized protein LOC124455550 n=1 Tax=Xenia sp. Carnegie-2017 TaxID=2897299 RepID=UPI001F0475F7|nr:uncharacterized protein LOC124455550 [Xenia sp. Carnegie-2017]